MSRIAKKPILIEKNVNVSINHGLFHVSGPKGDLELKLPEQLGVEISDYQITLKSNGKSDFSDAIGLYRTLIANAVSGVTLPWQKTLEMVGVGFRAQSSGSELILNVGFTHPVKITAPNGITFLVSENKITVSGADKYLVGEEAAKIRRIRPPEPYKGKGIRYLGEFIRKKAGKAAKTVGGVGTK